MFWPRLVTASTVFCHAEETNDVNAAHALRPVSVCVKNQTSAATSADIAVTTSMIGFAFIAAFNSHCFAAATVSARLNALMKPTTVVMIENSLNAPYPAMTATASACIQSAFCWTNVPTDWSMPPMLPRILESCWAAPPALYAPPVRPSRLPMTPANGPTTEPTAPAMLFTPLANVCTPSVFMSAPVKSFTHCIALPMPSPNAVTAPVMYGLTVLTMFAAPSTMVASRLPNAPSNVCVLSAALMAPSFMPSCMSASLNSCEVISPFAIASRKLPVYAPFLSIASWSLPEAPGIASASWFQFSVVSLPAPAVWVSIIATLLNVSLLPPATAFRLPAASASLS